MSDPDPNPDSECIPPVPQLPYACKAGIFGGEELVGDAQLSSDFFDLVRTFVTSFYVGSGSKFGSGVHSTSSTTMRVRLVFSAEMSWWVTLSCHLIFLIW
jgi:hypothetical protein